MSESEIPQWAWERARVETNKTEGAALSLGEVIAYRTGHAFARYIAEHEEPPVDPLLIEARELWILEGPDVFWNGTMYKNGSADEMIRAGKFDQHGPVQNYLRALHRGIELAKAQP